MVFSCSEDEDVHTTLQTMKGSSTREPIEISRPRRDLKSHGLGVTVRRGLRKSTIDDLIDGINRLAFARAAAKNKHPRDELKLRLVRLGPSLSFVVLAQNDVGNANRLTAMAAKNTAERLRGRIN